MKAKGLTGLAVLLCLQASSVVGQADSIIKQAETAYMQENYAAAIEGYDKVLATEGASAEIYYNLGNAYYKSKQMAGAALNYERALRLAPGDADIRFNLEMVRQQTVDKIEPVGDFFVVAWFAAVQNRATADSWAKIGVAGFLCFIGCLALYVFARRRRLKKLGFYFGWLFLTAVVVANVFARNQQRELEKRDKAIVFSPTVTVKSSPNASGTDLFILHEGTKVSVKSALGEWREIELADGNVGWMPAKDMEII